MTIRIEHDYLLHNAVYHDACLSTYLTYRPKYIDISVYDFACKGVVHVIDREKVSCNVINLYSVSIFLNK